MKIILLGGISFKNKAWIEEVDKELKPDFETKILYYDHWETGKEEMDFAREEEKLTEMAQGLNDYAMLAKSGGSWITLKAAAEGKISPQKLVLVGPAWNWARNNGFDPTMLARRVTVPVLAVDKTSDPSLPFDQLKAETETAGLNNFRLEEVAGDNHNYENVTQIGGLVREFLRGLTG